MRLSLKIHRHLRGMSMNIHWKKSIFKIIDIYGSENDFSTKEKADVDCYFQQPDYKDAHNKSSLHKKVKTLCIDLELTEDHHRKEMYITKKYQINIAERESIRV